MCWLGNVYRRAKRLKSIATVRFSYQAPVGDERGVEVRDVVNALLDLLPLAVDVDLDRHVGRELPAYIGGNFQP